MKIQFSLPTDDQFFNRYATLTPTLSKLGIIAQIISGLTEIGIFYSLIFSRIYPIAPTDAPLYATIGAILGTVFLELGLRKFTPYSVKAFLYKRFSGLDFAMTIFILFVTVGFFIASGTLSFMGSKEMVSIANANPSLENTIGIDSTYRQKKAETLNNYSLDSNAIAKGYHSQINLLNQKYQSLVKEQQTKLNQYLRKEERTGLSYQTKKEGITGYMASLEAEKAQLIGEIESKQAKELKALTSNRNNQFNKAENHYLANIADLEKRNATTLQNANSTTLLYGNGLAWFTLVCLGVFLFSVIIGEIHRKGSGIEQVAIPNQYQFSQSIGSEFLNMVSDKVNYTLRNIIKRLADKTPPPPLPTPPPNLYDLGKAKQQRITFEVKEGNSPIYSLSSPPTPKEGIKTNSIGGKSIVQNLANDTSIVATTKPIKKTPIRKSYNDGILQENERICNHCSKPYVYRHHKQKYCCDKCRILAWEQRTGKELKKKKRK